MSTTSQQIDNAARQLGISSSAPVVRQNLQIALDFFQSMTPPLPTDKQIGFLRGADLHSRDLAVVPLSIGQQLAAFRQPGLPFGFFYTQVGVSPFQLAINPAGRKFVRFSVIRSFLALRSRASHWRDPSFNPDGIPGGGIQYVVPQASQNLRVVQTSN